MDGAAAPGNLAFNKRPYFHAIFTTFTNCGCDQLVPLNMTGFRGFSSSNFEV